MSDSVDNATIYKVLLDIKGDVEGTKIGVQQLNNYINAVNGNMKELRRDYDDHKVDDDAHGKKTEDKANTRLWAKIAGLITVCQVASHLISIYAHR